MTKNTINNYASHNAQSKGPLNIWLEGLKIADWESPGDIISTFNTSDLLGKGSKRIVFNKISNIY